MVTNVDVKIIYFTKDTIIICHEKLLKIWLFKQIEP